MVVTLIISVERSDVAVTVDFFVFFLGIVVTVVMSSETSIPGMASGFEVTGPLPRRFFLP